jgi:hypothetical protein
MSGPDGDGLFTAIVDLPPGLHAYKLVVKQGGGDAWIFDPTQPRRKYVGDTGEQRDQGPGLSPTWP